MRTTSLTGLGLALLIMASGCAYHIKPPAASINLPRVSAPIPVVVGITEVEQKLTGGFPDLTIQIKKSLDESGLFQTVYYPVRSSDPLDGGIALRLTSRFKMDGAWFPKAFFSGFFMFLPTPVIYYNHEYQSECVLELSKDGRLLKTYQASGNVIASHKIFAPPEKLEAEGTEAAVKLLGANLVQQLIDDRAFIEKALKAPRTASVD